MPYYTHIPNQPTRPGPAERVNPRLLIQETAFVLQKSPWQVEQLRRKGRRLRFEGFSDFGIAEAGALPPTPKGNFPSEILPLICNNETAIVALRRIVDGEYHVQWVADKKAQPLPLIAILGSGY
jgi:hypothetical protein